MGITIPYFFGLRMGVGMGMVFIYNQLLISDVFGGLETQFNIKNKRFSKLSYFIQNLQFFYIKTILSGFFRNIKGLKIL